ncbi:MAG TPA: tetratricopeptide repeat protein, partial [Ktedonosporobacter sp.]|nr:tetratricopeptide repeat protein [Ktedonosporobacter sp.]
RGDPLEIGYAHERLGILKASLGELSACLAHMRTALTIYEQSEFVSLMVRICGNMGAAYISKGDLDSARTYLHRSLELTERAGNLPHMGFVLTNLGDTAYRSGDLLEAEARFRHGLSILEHNSSREAQAWALVDLAGAQQDMGTLSEAKASLLNALTIGRAIKSSRCNRYALIRLAEIRVAEAQLAFPWPALDDACPDQPSPYYQRLLLRTKFTLQRAISLDGLEIEPLVEGKRLLATVYFLQHDLLAAQQLALQVLQQAQSQEVTRSIGRAYVLLGNIMAVRKDYHEADRYFEQAIQLFRERKYKLEYARVLYSYGLTLVQRARLSRRKCPEILLSADQQEADTFYGLSSLYEAQAIFTASHASLDLQQVEQLLARVGVQNATL